MNTRTCQMTEKIQVHEVKKAGFFREQYLWLRSAVFCMSAYPSHVENHKLHLKKLTRDCKKWIQEMIEFHCSAAEVGTIHPYAQLIWSNAVPTAATCSSLINEKFLQCKAYSEVSDTWHRTQIVRSDKIILSSHTLNDSCALYNQYILLSCLEFLSHPDIHQKKGVRLSLLLHLCNCFCKCVSQYICCQSIIDSYFATPADQSTRWIFLARSGQRDLNNAFHAVLKFPQLPRFLPFLKQMLVDSWPFQHLNGISSCNFCKANGGKCINRPSNRSDGSSYIADERSFPKSSRRISFPSFFMHRDIREGTSAMLERPRSQKTARYARNYIKGRRWIDYPSIEMKRK